MRPRRRGHRSCSSISAPQARNPRSPRTFAKDGPTSEPGVRPVQSIRPVSQRDPQLCAHSVLAHNKWLDDCRHPPNLGSSPVMLRCVGPSSCARPRRLGKCRPRTAGRAAIEEKSSGIPEHSLRSTTPACSHQRYRAWPRYLASGRLGWHLGTDDRGGPTPPPVAGDATGTFRFDR
jgi:hypothetical protein